MVDRLHFREYENETQAMLSKGTNYRSLNTEIANKYQQAKVEWLNEFCRNRRVMSIKNKSSIHKRIKKCIKSKRLFIIKKEKNEYVRVRFYGEWEKIAIHKNMERKKILKSKVRSMLSKMNKNKAVSWVWQ